MKCTVYPVYTLLRADQSPKGAAVVIDTLRMTTVRRPRWKTAAGLCGQ